MKRDPNNLIRQAYQIEDISTEECRAVFFDWALGLESGADPAAEAKVLQLEFTGKYPDHPMTVLLAETSQGTASKPTRKRRRRRA